jgi:hypothetical protein
MARAFLPGLAFGLEGTLVQRADLHPEGKELTKY